LPRFAIAKQVIDGNNRFLYAMSTRLNCPFYTDMIEKIHEKVPVLFLSDPRTKKTEPLRILWRGKTYKNVKLGLHYTDRQGRTLRHIFTFSTESLDLKIIFDTDDLSFTIEEAVEE
jgi:hypothetical protein